MSKMCDETENRRLTGRWFDPEPSKVEKRLTEEQLEARGLVLAGMAGQKATIAALRAENERLREALKDIAVYGCGMLSQPPAMNSPEETWLRMRIREYEKRARAALSGEIRAELPTETMTSLEKYGTSER